MTNSLIALLPPSETKRDGGSAVSASLFGPVQDEAREEALTELRALAGDAEAHQRALKLSDKLAETERARNLALCDAPRMPALERYTGVLYDALDVASLPDAARTWALERYVIQSALWGLVRGSDAIPAYRCSASTGLGKRSMKQRWARACAAVLAEHKGVVLHLRSKSYAALGPLPDRDDALVLEFVTRMPTGELKQLNHFNKQGKGEFLRTLALADSEVHEQLDAVGDMEGLCSVLRALGIEIDPVSEREAMVTVDDPRQQRLGQSTTTG